MNVAVILNKDELRETLAELSLEVSQTIIKQIRAETPVARPVMTLAQLAEYLQVTTQSIRKWIRRCKTENPLPSHSVGQDPRFHLSEINEWSRREAERQAEKRKKISDAFSRNSTISG